MTSLLARFVACPAIALLSTAAFAQTPVSAPGGFVPQQAIAFGPAGGTATAVDAAHPLPVTCVTGCSGGGGGGGVGGTIVIDQTTDGTTNLVAVRSAPPAAAATTTMASGTSLSAAIDLGDQRLHRITLPAAWTAAAITFQSSADGTTYSDLYDAGGELTLSTTVVGASRSIVVDPAAFIGIRYLKLRSGTSTTPVSQAADRSLVLVTVAR